MPKFKQVSSRTGISIRQPDIKYRTLGLGSRGYSCLGSKKNGIYKILCFHVQVIFYWNDIKILKRMNKVCQCPKQLPLNNECATFFFFNEEMPE